MRSFHRVRAAVQGLSLVLFTALLLSGSRLYFHLDPLVPLMGLLAGEPVPWMMSLSLIPLSLTLLLGRFYCGWICPLGALNHLVSSAATRLGARRRAVGEGPRSLKFVILILTLVTAALGAPALATLDPVSLLTRSAAAATIPIAKLTTAASAAPHAQAEAIGVVLLIILAANAYRPRLWCHTACPLGALFTAVARLGRLRVAAAPSCGGCGRCSRRCPGNGGPNGTAGSGDCFLCLSCSAECPEGAVAITTARDDGTRRSPVDLGRRRALGAVLSGAFLAALPRVAPGASGRRRDFTRPPGAVAEEAFLDRCLRCGACVQACATGYVQPAGLQAGAEGLWTPVLDARLGYCAWDCARCTEVCPTGAITELTLLEKREWKVGVAVVDRSRCFTWADAFDCKACANACPVEGAMRFHEAEVWNHEGRRVRVERLHVDPETCTGCGICAHVCPRRDAAGVTIGCDGERRESVFG